MLSIFRSMATCAADVTVGPRLLKRHPCRLHVTLHRSGLAHYQLRRYGKGIHCVKVRVEISRANLLCELCDEGPRCFATPARETGGTALRTRSVASGRRVRVCRAPSPRPEAYQTPLQINRRAQRECCIHLGRTACTQGAYRARRDIVKCGAGCPPAHRGNCQALELG